MKDTNCGYCMRGGLLDAFGIVICDLSVSTLILFREQSHQLFHGKVLLSVLLMETEQEDLLLPTGNIVTIQQ